MRDLAPLIGRQDAHNAVYYCCKESIESKMPLLNVLLSRREFTEKIEKDKLTAL